MKNTYILAFAFLLVTPFTFGQITLSQADFPNVNDQIIYSKSLNFPSISIGSAGTSQVFDFTQAGSFTSDTLKYVDPTQTIYGPKLPSSNLAFTSSFDSSMTFFNSTVNSVEILAILTSTPLGNGNVFAKATANATEIKFPFNYLEQFTSNASFTTDAIYFHQDLTANPYTYFDSIKGIVTVVRNSVVDAWGDFKSPSINGIPAIRQKITDITTYTPQFFVFYVDTIFGSAVTFPLGYQTIPGTEFTDTVITYNFLSNKGSNTPMMMAQVKSDSKGNITEAKYSEKQVLNVSSLETDFHFNVFPSPSTDQIEIKSGATLISIKIQDMNGKTIEEFKVNGKYVKYNTQKLNSGTYFITAVSSNGLQTKKFIKN